MNKYKAIFSKIGKIEKAIDRLNSELSDLGDLLTKQSEVDGLKFIATLVDGDGLVATPVKNDLSNIELPHGEDCVIPLDDLISRLPISDINELPIGI